MKVVLMRLTGVLMLFYIVFGASAQDGFGFGFDDEDAGGMDGAFGGSAPAVSIGGEVSAAMTGFIDDFSDGPGDTQLGNIFSGKLKFSAETTNAEGIINLKLAPGLVYYDEKSPVYVDEAYITAYFGKLDITGGLRKLTWGKADSSGPLDVINPLDSSAIYPEMADKNDLMALKIARPLVHASVRFGQFSKLEGVFVPNFEPVHFTSSGRWVPAQMAMINQLPPENVIHPDTSTLDYAQAGLRFTTTIEGAADIGVQYYYGRLTTPAVAITVPTGIPPLPMATFAYNPYHQIGLDYAQVIAGFNLRTEFAANITEDLEGDNGSVYNPALAWSLGFDRDLFAGINLNVQANETIRLMDDNVGSPDAASGSFDIEGGTDSTVTRIAATLSRKFLRDELELRAAAVWGIEDKGFILMPALIWTKDTVTLACSGGIFGGDKEGQLGQYHQNNFVKIGITYTF
jgi:hypothetical protein